MSDRKKAFWFIALLSVLVVVPFLGETIFYSKGEPREAIVALSMLESGNWILPVNYGTDIAYKPPFFWRGDGVFRPFPVCIGFFSHAVNVLCLCGKT